MSEKNASIVPEETIISKIYLIRGQKVMLDMDLADLYGVDTKQLKRTVRRNQKRFPSDFMFELSKGELENLRSHFGTSSWGGIRYPPMAFTEQGVVMLSSLLHSDWAIMVNIKIVRVFTRMRHLIESHTEILHQLEQLQMKDVEHDQQIQLIFEYIKQLEQSKQQHDQQASRKRIGFKQDK